MAGPQPTGYRRAACPRRWISDESGTYALSVRVTQPPSPATVSSPPTDSRPRPRRWPRARSYHCGQALRGDASDTQVVNGRAEAFEQRKKLIQGQPGMRKLRMEGRIGSQLTNVPHSVAIVRRQELALAATAKSRYFACKGYWRLALRQVSKSDFPSCQEDEMREFEVAGKTGMLEPPLDLYMGQRRRAVCCTADGAQWPHTR
jgi:hypothetical protein